MGELIWGITTTGGLPVDWTLVRLAAAARRCKLLVFGVSCVLFFGRTELLHTSCLSPPVLINTVIVPLCLCSVGLATAWLLNTNMFHDLTYITMWDGLCLDSSTTSHSARPPCVRTHVGSFESLVCKLSGPTSLTPVETRLVSFILHPGLPLNSGQWKPKNVN